MTIDPNTGAISWTPTEAQGPSTNTITVVVTDSNPLASNNQHLTDTKSFTVVVNEVNTAPQLTVPGSQVADALKPFTVSVSATDSDLPANALTFSLVSPPTGMTIDPNTGAISWTPTVAQGPSTNNITVVVTDSNPAAINAQHLSATNSFTVVVRVNTAPTLQPIADQTLHFGTPLVLQAVAFDTDVPKQTLTYVLDLGFPTGMTIDSATGVISWTPTESQVGTYTVTVRVTDNGLPPLNATTTFHVTVSGSGSRLDIQQVPPFVQITITADVGNNYELQRSTDLVIWEKINQYFPLKNSPTTYVDPDSRTGPLFFYRLHLVQ
jgi:hypothetical protein